MQELARPVEADAVDFTTLQNFAALRGQLRVSLTPRCNIACWFCHNEGDVPPPLTKVDRSRQPRARAVTPEGYLTLIRALMSAGLKRLYFTGGEPLTSPMARPVLERLPEHSPDASYTLITNGTRIRAHRAWLARTRLDKVKVSLHYFSDESLRAIAGIRIGIDTVLDGIEVARETFPRVELNTVLQKENAHEVEGILDYALERRLPVQFIELVGTDFNEARAHGPGDGRRHIEINNDAGTLTKAGVKGPIGVFSQQADTVYIANLLDQLRHDRRSVQASRAGTPLQRFGVLRHVGPRTFSFGCTVGLS